MTKSHGQSTRRRTAFDPHGKQEAERKDKLIERFRLLTAAQRALWAQEDAEAAGGTAEAYRQEQGS